MKPQTQTVFGGGQSGSEPGNCLAACIASLLELPIADVPNFVAQDRWFEALQEWLGRRGLRYLVVHLAAAESMVCDGFQGVYHTMFGPGPRGRNHCVVGLGGTPVHDPHPSGAMLEDCEWMGFLVSMDPAQKASVKP